MTEGGTWHGEYREATGFGYRIGSKYLPAVEEGHSVLSSVGSSGREESFFTFAAQTGTEVTVCPLRLLYGGLELQDRQVVIPPATCVFIGRVDQQVYNQPRHIAGMDRLFVREAWTWRRC